MSLKKNLYLSFNSILKLKVSFSILTLEFVISDEGKNFLRALDGPFGVVSVAGMYRTGKSYLINRMLLNREKGFGVGPTINPCTKGLWIWGTPIPGFTSDGEAINVLVIDTEGLGALDEDSNHDVRVFSLALLLSSYFIYNSVGSIDETALQNLNLVVSITKHIHIKAQSEDVDPEEYSKYFPSFMWVVRDFTLQLIDEQGDTITSKEYFERALQPQSGFSEAIEQKNRVRKLIKSFFTERDCCTIVRPLTKEEHLQNLEEMNIKELRSEFVEQMMLLRRKILHMIKVKTLNGSTLSGAMLLSLAENYVAAINRGVVPNIENAWTYICKSECAKAFQVGLERYDSTIKSFVNECFPIDQEELKEMHKEAYRAAIEEFKKASVGNDLSDYIKDLKVKIKQKYTNLVVENERETKRCVYDFLSHGYMSIEQKLKSNAFNTFDEYVRELKGFQVYFLQNGPPGPNRKALMLEYCQKAQAEVASIFESKLVPEIELQSTLSRETMQKLEVQIAELKEEHRAETNSMATKIRLLETERTELSAKEQGLREDCNAMRKEKESIQRELEERYSEEKKQTERTIKALREKMATQDEQMRAAQEKVLTIESDFNKQEALAEQKISYLEKSLEEVKGKEKEYAAELKGVKREHQASIKELTSKYEAQIKELQTKLDSSKDQVSELETKVVEMQQTYDNMKLQLVEEKEGEKFKYEESVKCISDLKMNVATLNNKLKSQEKSMQAAFNKERNEFQTKVADLQATIKNLNDQLKTMAIKCEKEEAVRKQREEFYKLQLGEAKRQLEEAQKSHNTMMKTLQGKSRSGDTQEANKQLFLMKEEHLNEMKELERGYKEGRDKLSSQLEQTSERASELELKLKLVETNYSKELEGKNEVITTLQGQLNKATQQVKALESQKVNLLEETEKNYKEIIENLEVQAEDKQKKYGEDLKEMQRRSEESLTQLKSFYEIEKERLEGRIIEEREKANRVCAQQMEECETRIKEEQQLREEEVEALQKNLSECEEQSRMAIGRLEQELDMQRQNSKAIEIKLKEAKEQFNKLQAINSAALEQQMNSFNEERKGMVDKVEKLSHEITVKERQITSLENKVESMKQDLERNARNTDAWKLEKINEKNSLTEKIETLKTKNQQLADELIQKKLESSRELALLKQQMEFSINKIKELQQNIEELTLRHEEKLKLLKQEHNQELKETIERLERDKEIYEQKYEQKRRALKELEGNISIQTNRAEKEKTTLNEKYILLEEKYNKLDKQYKTEVKLLQGQLSQFNDSLSNDKMGVVHENEKLKKELNELDRQLCEVQANYEKDKELWADKFSFLEQQRDQYKTDLLDAQRKFETTLEHLQKRGSLYKDKFDVNQLTMISSLEQKYNSKIKELNEVNQRSYNELMQKNKQLEKEMKEMEEKMLLEQRMKFTESSTLEKRATEALHNLSKVSKELDEIKADRDRRMLEYQKVYEKERENYKVKLQEIEAKYIEADRKRSSMLMEFEKERARWSLEKDHLIVQKNEAQEIIATLEKKKENLIIENDKLKSERLTRKPFYSAVSNSVASSSRYISGRYKENYSGAKMLLEERRGRDGSDTSSDYR
jgi:chromosome segregation ATPase